MVMGTLETKIRFRDTTNKVSVNVWPVMYNYCIVVIEVFCSLFSLFLEILNDCSDVDEIKFQEDGTWCPMRPKKEAVKVPSQSVQKIERKYVIVIPEQGLKWSYRQVLFM